ncbi:hypothetical protein [Mycolicibacterium aubagnense]|uniref:Transposase putative helix-turn-helix domain-containing protein n=1 Tax=Mycolicibacterium aubagnense TaxID=319707 RepID=A0ABN5Z4M1_9MYCO|nr:hypothetical protein [Mycolicibacterium aubagnense]TLH64300.1 hypothetical protein C1S80_12910 [Mycolicibacterium aubagnense]BBX87956.1 hypothetical protein MAUB_58290 [Mycolicibacterium aubagnense]
MAGSGGYRRSESAGNRNTVGIPVCHGDSGKRDRAELKTLGVTRWVCNVTMHIQVLLRSQ